ncbi:MAG: cytochrome c oxidase subunit 3 [Planctomycetota bacterium]|jgi:cytochrome c oxidase subunit 3|nr:cytochrome c oxidase subunit 3 [Planctomycetota bacterium]
MSEVADTHADQHEDPMSHVPPPSFWPFIIGIALVAFMAGAVLTLPKVAASVPISGVPVLIFGAVAVLFGLMGWGHQIIKEKRIAHDLMAQQVDLKFFVKSFLVSELMAFSAIFAYFYLRTFFVAPDSFESPPGLHLGGSMVAFATFLLLSSSVTCEMAHHAVMHNQMGKARMLMIATLVLGFIFLGFQGREYGELITHGFWPLSMGEENPNTAFMATFFISTGFHGFHVLTGLVMLFLVYVRMEMGHFTQKRHFSLVAASWYWHFVDIVWVLLFITVYVV